MASCYDIMASSRHDTNCRECVLSTRNTIQNFFIRFLQSFGWTVDKCNNIKITLVTCTVDLVGQGRLKTKLSFLFLSLEVLER